MKLLILFLVLLGSPGRNIVNEVDRIHYNVHYDEFCLPEFSQIIFEDWSKQRRCFIVRSWRLLREDWDKITEEEEKLLKENKGLSEDELYRLKKLSEHKEAWMEKTHTLCDKKKYPFKSLEKKYRGIYDPKNYPIKNNHTGNYEYTFYQEGIKVTVVSKIFIETFTQIDPERENRKILPDNDRVPIKTNFKEDRNYFLYQEIEKMIISH